MIVFFHSLVLVDFSSSGHMKTNVPKAPGNITFSPLLAAHRPKTASELEGDKTEGMTLKRANACLRSNILRLVPFVMSQSAIINFQLG